MKVTESITVNILDDMVIDLWQPHVDPTWIRCAKAIITVRQSDGLTGCGRVYNTELRAPMSVLPWYSLKTQ